jgi:hypothetical protein
LAQAAGSWAEPFSGWLIVGPAMNANLKIPLPGRLGCV